MRPIGGELVKTITSPSCWGTHFLYLSNPPSGNLLPIIPWVVPCISAGVNIAQGRNASVFRRWRQTNERNTVFSISSLVTSPSSHLPRQIIITLNANNAADSEAQVQPGSGLRCGRGWRPQESGPTYASQGHTNRES